MSKKKEEKVAEEVKEEKPKKESKKKEVKKEEAKPKKKTTKKKSAPKKRKRVRVDKDTEILIMSNTHGWTGYTSPMGDINIIFKEFGDSDYITMQELTQMHNRHRKLLGELRILIVDVLSDEYTVEDVLRQLSLLDLYKESVLPTDMEDFILESTTRELQSRIERMPEPSAKKVVESAVRLYKAGKLDSISKMDFFNRFVNRGKNIFE